MLTFVLPAVLAGLLGLIPAQAETAAEYIPRLRIMFLGAAGLGYLGIAAFLFRKTSGWKRWLALVWSLAAVRVFYAPILGGALFMTGWAAWLARMIGDQSLVTAVHYSLACFTAALSGCVALTALLAGANLKKIGWLLIALLCVGQGVLAFWLPEDRHPSPHPFADAPPAAARGPAYLDVVEDSKRKPVTRILAAGATVRHAISPRSRWGGEVRKGLLARGRANPAMGLRVRVNCLEAALLQARDLLAGADDEAKDDKGTDGDTGAG